MSKRAITISIIVVAMISLSAFLVFSKVGGAASDVAKAYANTEIFEKAIVSANANNGIVAYFGKLEPLDKMAIFEGETTYSEDDTYFKSAVSVKGTLRDAKLDVEATFKNEAWQLSFVAVRLKKSESTKKRIVVLRKTQ